MRGSRPSSTNGNEVHDEHERFVGTDDAAGAAFPIGERRRNRDPPSAVEDAPPVYVGQLALYRTVLGKIYPDRPIRAALVWTEVPEVMELPAEMLDEAAARITSG